MRNKFEKRIYEFLKKKKVKFQYEGLKIPYVIYGNYIPDYIIDTGDKQIYIEAKGHFRPEAMRKMLAVKASNPNIDIRIVFYSFNKKYVKWADKHGFPYAIAEIPEQWLEEMKCRTKRNKHC